ncbi:MAG: hypothetical protein JNK57_06555 [Planctomycetaceae bacterium]|nr:hypothetical protein [Planctomycetaceae bacterium]
MKHSSFLVSLSIGGIWFGLAVAAIGQDVIQREIVIHPKKISENVLDVRLLPRAADQEPGNAAPVLLRMTYEMHNWMINERPKLTKELAASDHDDMELQAFIFDTFAPQIIRAGKMTNANWEYPLHSSQPYLILLPDAQSMHQLLGDGMTIWIKQQISKKDFPASLMGIQAQLSCARHLAATPVMVSQMFGNNVARQALDNLELLVQQSADIENMYWALAILPRSIGDLSATAEWESYAFRKMLPSLTEPLPERGSNSWPQIASEFIKMMEYTSQESYSATEIQTLTGKLDQCASRFLSEELGWTDQQLRQVSIEERIMRWVIVQRHWFDLQTEQMTVSSIPEALEIYRQIKDKSESIVQEIGSKHDPFAGIAEPIIRCFQFHRRVRILQTIEAIRDYAAQNAGQLPENLEQLRFPAPADPFTGQAFEYRKTNSEAWLSYPPVAGDPNPTRSYHLSIQPK